MAAWRELSAELDRWAGAGRCAGFWWRDDDAGPDDPRLPALLARRRRLAVPLALAVVPERLTTATARAILADEGTGVLQHGIRHANLAAPGRRRRELAAEALAAGLDADMAAARERLARTFGPRFHAVMVPPWNRIDDRVREALAAAGFHGLSALGPRPAARHGALGLANVHIDILDWKGGRRFAGEEACLAAACRHLRARRLGRVDGGEATGLMTHHLAHDRDCLGFIDRFVATVRDHAAARWLGAADLFPRMRR